VGAIGNGVELLEMTGQAAGAEVELIRDAVRAADARVRLFRLAFGGAAPEQTVSARDARSAAEGYVHQTRINLDWRLQGDAPRMGVKVGVLMLLCAESALPMGGDVRIGPAGDGTWDMQATGPRILVEDSIWATLRFGSPENGRSLRAAEAHFITLTLAAQALGQDVDYVVEGDTLNLRTR